MPAENMLIENVTCARAHGLTIGTCLATRASTNRAPFAGSQLVWELPSSDRRHPPLVSLLTMMTFVTGSSTSGGIRNITFRHVTVEHSSSPVCIRTCRNRGGVISDVSFCALSHLADT